jgi:hypothetical protein
MTTSITRRDFLGKLLGGSVLFVQAVVRAKGSGLFMDQIKGQSG